MISFLSLGSCMGDSISILENAIKELAQLPKTKIIARASFYQTEAVDVPEKYKDIFFINTAVLLETLLSCNQLSSEVHAIETRLGRIRTNERHAPRSIDIDLISCDDIRINRTDLRLPHPEAAHRRFVMEPIAEMDPNFILPGQSLTAQEILSSLPTSPSVLRLTPHTGSLPSTR